MRQQASSKRHKASSKQHKVSSKRSFLPFYLFTFLLFLSSCYHKQTPAVSPLTGDTIQLVDSTAYYRQLDSLAFARTHHYTDNFNFVVREDSLVLLRQEPEEEVNHMMTDSFAVYKDQRLVVADIRIISNDPVDSVWVQLGTEQSDFGWTHETELLDRVDPDDPISQFISFFSDSHMLIFLVVFGLMAASYLLWKTMRRNAKIVHFNDIDSFYPTLLALLVAASATFYATIQLFAPDTWREFYFHPSLNPFSQPAVIEVFLISVWSMLIIGLAALDDVMRQLRSGDAILYMGGLAAVCAFNYIIFSISTLYYVGYLLLVAYVVLAIRQYFHHSHSRFYCGSCGAELREKGRCPKCGAVND